VVVHNLEAPAQEEAETEETEEVVADRKTDLLQLLTLAAAAAAVDTTLFQIRATPAAQVVQAS